MTHPTGITHHIFLDYLKMFGNHLEAVLTSIVDQMEVFSVTVPWRQGNSFNIPKTTF
jgi:hypothetical protein